jgi:hypothetical protein
VQGDASTEAHEHRAECGCRVVGGSPRLRSLSLSWFALALWVFVRRSRRRGTTR